MEAGDLPRTQSFDCGVAVLNEWLQRFAWQNHNSGGARVYIAVDDAADHIAGYYCLSAASVDYAATPRGVSKGLARHLIAVVLIGRLAVDAGYRGLGLGRFLIRDAFVRILETADKIGIRAVMVQAKDNAASEFYRDLGFVPSIDDPSQFFMALKDAKKSLATADRK
jgi:GNAT superfamily N-acetyltransferase